MSAKGKQLDSGIDHEKEKLKDVHGSEVDDMGLLGYGVMYTVGADWNCIVPRDWLMERVNDLGLPRWLAPSEPSPHYAYDRAMKWMREDWLTPYTIQAPRMDNDIPEDHTVEVQLQSGDGSRIWHIYAEVFFDEEESKQDGGTWVKHHLGHFYYDSGAKRLQHSVDDDLDADHHLWSVWQDISNGAEGLFNRMMNCHIAQDIRKMMYDTVTKHTNNVIKLRRSVYLFPSGMGDFVEAMATLYSDINAEWKTTGEPVAVRTFEVLDTDDKEEWIQHQVHATLEENLDDLLETAFNEFDEGEAADDVVDIINDNLDATSETAETYNAMLEAEISIEEALKAQKQNITDAEHQEIVDAVMEDID